MLRHQRTQKLALLDFGLRMVQLGVILKVQAFGYLRCVHKLGWAQIIDSFGTSAQQRADKHKDDNCQKYA